ncbi:MAG: hypothetical protein ACRCVX_14265 [Shewanella sp.]
MTTLDIVKELMSELQAALRESLEAQGHKLTGRLSDSITYELSEDGRDAVGRMYFAEYGVYVNAGVSANRIPYGKGKGRKGGTSLYIQGLVEFWEKKGLSGREALGAAFATAKVHARDGMPSTASRRFSSTGERTGFVRAAIDSRLNDIEKKLGVKFGGQLTLQLVGQYKEAVSGSLKLKVA